jgi:2-oxoglutarate ferredoxin oxidoreductase subunit gamma
MLEMRVSGYGGQGIIRSGLIIGKATSLYEEKNSTLTQSFGPEARGSACSAQLVISDERVLYPYITKPKVLISMSQEAYNKFVPNLAEGGTLIIDDDLVKPGEVRKDVRLYSIPATRFAEELGARIAANICMIGFFTAVTEIASPDSMKKALHGLVPSRYMDLNLRAFDKGYEYGKERVKEVGVASIEGWSAGKKKKRASKK